MLHFMQFCLFLCAASTPFCLHSQGQGSDLGRNKAFLLVKTYFEQEQFPCEHPLASVTMAQRIGRDRSALCYQQQWGLQWTLSSAWFWQIAFGLHYSSWYLWHKASIYHINSQWGHIYSSRMVLHSAMVNYLLRICTDKSTLIGE